MTVLHVAGVSQVAWVDHGSAHPDGVCHRPSDRQRGCVQYRSVGGEATLLHTARGC
jgi:hypothetical protein